MAIMQVYINDELVCSCGGEDLYMLGASIYATGDLSDRNQMEFDYSFSGILSKSDQEEKRFSRWIPDKKISLNDKLTIKFVEGDKFDIPTIKEEFIND